MKIVVNRCFGGFSLSHEAIMRYSELAKLNLVVIKDEKYSGECFWNYYLNGIEDADHYWYDRDLERNDPFLVQVVEELGEKADGMCAKLNVVEIPDNVSWEIAEYDGLEHVAETHRTW